MWETDRSGRREEMRADPPTDRSQGDGGSIKTTSHSGDTITSSFHDRDALLTSADTAFFNVLSPSVSDTAVLVVTHSTVIDLFCSREIDRCLLANDFSEQSRLMQSAIDSSKRPVLIDSSNSRVSRSQLTNSCKRPAVSGLSKRLEFLNRVVVNDLSLIELW